MSMTELDTLDTGTAYASEFALLDQIDASILEASPPASRRSNEARIQSHDAVKSAKIMIIDDDHFTVMVVCKFLRDEGYENFATTTDSTEALGLVHRTRPDVVLLDVMMPGVSGLDLLRLMRSDDELKHVPVLIFTASSERAVKREALELGATDFLPKPVDPNDLIPRIGNALMQKAYRDRLKDHAAELESQVRRRTTELVASREEVLHCLARAAEYRDDDTGRHVIRVGQYAGVIARELGFSGERVELIQLAAQLHDIGKIGISDSILQKPGKLDPDQIELMQSHCAMGKKIIEPFCEDDWKALRRHATVGANLLNVRSSPLLMLAARIAQTHHERWDGKGYPLGLAGQDIPIEGRITAVADVYDALSSKRPYKPPYPREKCFEILEQGRGTRFDPKVLDAFFNRTADIIEIQLKYMDLT